MISILRCRVFPQYRGHMVLFPRLHGTIPGNFRNFHFRTNALDGSNKILPLISKVEPYNFSSLNSRSFATTSPSIIDKIKPTSQRWKDFLRVGAAIIGIYAVVKIGWVVIDFASCIQTYGKDPFKALAIISTDGVTIAYIIGFTSTFAIMYFCNRARSHIFAIHPEEAFQKFTKDILSNQLVQRQMGGKVKLGKFRSYSFEKSGLRLEPRKLQILFHIESIDRKNNNIEKPEMSLFPSYLNAYNSSLSSDIEETIPTSGGIISAIIQKDLFGELSCEYAVMDSLITGSRTVLIDNLTFGDKPNIMYGGITLLDNEKKKTPDDILKQLKETQQVVVQGDSQLQKEKSEQDEQEQKKVKEKQQRQ